MCVIQNYSIEFFSLLKIFAYANNKISIDNKLN